MNLVARFRSCRWSPLTPINSPNLCTNSWRNGHSCWGGGWAESGWVHCAMRLGQKNYGQAMVLAMFDDRVRLRTYWPMETKTNTHGNRPPYDLRLSETMLPPDLRVHQCYARNRTEPDGTGRLPGAHACRTKWFSFSTDPDEACKGLLPRVAGNQKRGVLPSKSITIPSIYLDIRYCFRGWQN